MKNQLIHPGCAILIIALGTALPLNAQAPAPIDSNPSVVSGEVNFHGLETPHAVITQDSSRAIVDYSHFNVLPGGSVEFIQPGSDAAILNRITGNVPSMIEGLVTANGQVYFVNPAGVTFGEGSIIRADTFLAAAGDLTDEDFLSSNLDFELSGSVMNAGTIEGARAVFLLGTQVINTGEIISREGIVVLAGGDRIYLQPVGSSLLVEVTTEAGSPVDGIGIDNQGAVSGGDILFSAGDAYSLALKHSGKAVVANSARLYSDGGAIEISGEINVPGGVVEVGGTDRGGPGAPRASRTTIAESGLIDVSAEDTGDGGQAVIWADEKTTFLGTFQGEGKNGGAGGTLEISAAEVDMGTGEWNISLGQGGELLFDPLNVTIDATAATNIVNQMNAGTSVTVDTNAAPFGGAGAEDGDIVVDAQIQVTNTANQGRLNLIAARDIIINQRITSLQPVSQPQIISFQASRNIQVNALIQAALSSTARIALTAQTGNVTLTGTGSIDSGGSAIEISAGGDFNIETGAQILTGINTSTDLMVSIVAAGTANFNGGLIQTFGATLTDIRASRLLNQTGVNAIINIGGARGWQIVLPHPYGETATTNPHIYGGLISNIPASFYKVGAPSNFTSTQNAYAFRFQPVIDVVVNNDTKDYGELSAADFSSVTVDPAGLVDASLYGNVFAQDTVESINLGTPTFASDGASQTAGAGKYTITASRASSIAGYIPNYVPGTLTINPRPVSLSTPNQGKIYGEVLALDDTTFSVLDVDGDALLPNGEVIDAITLVAVTGVDASTTAAAGTYVDEITITGQTGSNGFDAANYDLSYVAGDLVVDPRDITLTAVAQERAFYQEMIPDQTAFTITDADGDSILPNGEQIDLANIVSVNEIAGNREALPGVYTDNLTITGQSGSGGFDPGNYSVSYTAGDLSIKGPSAPPLLLEEGFPGFPDELSGIDDANPRSDSIIFIPGTTLLTVFDKSDSNPPLNQEQAE